MTGALSLPLGVNLSRFDQDLRRVADRIENVGKSVSVKVGSTAGKLAEGGFSGDEIAARVSQIGERIAVGIANGVRNTPQVLTRIFNRINAMLDKLVGSAVATFQKIDGAMKFPSFDAFLKRTKAGLDNFASGSKEKLSALELALVGGLGVGFEKAAKLALSLFDKMQEPIAKSIERGFELVEPKIEAIITSITSSIEGAFKTTGETITGRLEKSILGVATTIENTFADAFKRGFGRGEAAAEMVFAKIEQAAKPMYEKFAAMGGGGLKSTVPGPKIGRNVEFTSAPVIKAAPQLQLPAPEPKPIVIPDIKFAPDNQSQIAKIDAVKKALGGAAKAYVASTKEMGMAYLHGGARVASTALGGTIAIRKLKSVVSSLKDVSKASYGEMFEGGKKAEQGLEAVTKKAGKLKDGLSGSVAPANRLGNAIKSIGGQIAIAFGAVGAVYKLVQFFKEGVSGASALEEATNRASTVFGSAFGKVDAQADVMNRRFRKLKSSQFELASGFGAMAKSAGFSEQASAELANRMTMISANLASSVKIGFEDAGAKVRSVLAGNSEPLRQYGANVTELAVRNYALAHGLADSTGAISEQAKIMARAELIAQGLAYTEGDLERTIGSAANQFALAGGGIKEFGVRIGQLLLPAITKATEAFNELLGSVLAATENSSSVLDSWSDKIASAMDYVGFAVRNAGGIWKIAQINVTEFVANALAWIDTLPENIGRITSWIGRNWWNMLKDIGSGTKTVLANLGSNMKSFVEALWSALSGGSFDFKWTPLLDGFKATTEKLPELIKPALVDMSGEVEKVMKGITEKELARTRSIAEAGKHVAKSAEFKGLVAPGQETPAKSEYRLGGALEVGSREAFSAISRNLAGRKSSTDVAKQGVAVQKTIAQNTREMADQLKARKAPMELQVF